MADPVIDLSHWNEPVDFDEMARAGVVGVIHKATEGAGYIDSEYDRRKQEAAEAGLLWGAYHFMRPGDMVQQARHFVDIAGDIGLYAADHEDEEVSVDDLKEFLREVERLTGTKAVVYSGYVIKQQLKGRDDELAKHRLWLAHYTSGTPTWPTETWEQWWLWQYTDEGDCPGVGGYVDCNRYTGDDDDLRTEWTEEAAEEKIPTVTITIKTQGKVRVTVITDEDKNGDS